MPNCNEGQITVPTAASFVRQRTLQHVGRSGPINNTRWLRRMREQVLAQLPVGCAPGVMVRISVALLPLGPVVVRLWFTVPVDGL